MAASESTLGLLHTIVAQSLIDKIKSGEATASDVSNALKMLKDNNITCAPSEDNAIGELERELSKHTTKVAPVTDDDLAAALEAADFSLDRAN